MKKYFSLSIAFLPIFAALVFAQPTRADNQLYLPIQSKEIIYDPAEQTAASFVKNIVTGKSFRLVSDRLPHPPVEVETDVIGRSPVELHGGRFLLER